MKTIIAMTENGKREPVYFWSGSLTGFFSPENKYQDIQGSELTTDRDRATVFPTLTSAKAAYHNQGMRTHTIAMSGYGFYRPGAEIVL